jgi:lipopolysaccharide export system protein LptC
MSSPIETAASGSSRRAAAAARRARLAPVISLVAMLLGAIILIVFLVQAGFFNALVPHPATPGFTVEKPDQITGQFSRMGGFDRQNQPYEVTAQSGYQDAANPSLVHMDQITGKFQKVTGAAYDLTATSGIYDTKAKDMDLEGQVKITSEGRFTATMARAKVNIDKKSLVSDVPVEVLTDSGKISANGLQITNDGNNILFLNGVKAHFEAASKKGDEGQ